MPVFDQSAQYAVVGISSNLVVYAPLNIGGVYGNTNDGLADFTHGLQHRISGKNLILVSGCNPAILGDDGKLTRYSTLLDNEPKLLAGLGDLTKVHQLGPRTPEGGKYKATEFQDGMCTYQTGSEKVRVPSILAYDAGFVVEVTEELGQGATPASERGILGRLHGLKGMQAGWHFETQREGRVLCYKDTPIVGITPDGGEDSVVLRTDENSLRTLAEAFGKVPATLSIGFNQNFGPITFVANYVPLNSEEVIAQTPLSAEVASSGYPLVLPIDRLGLCDITVTQYDSAQGVMRDRKVDLLTTITTMGMYAGAAKNEFWQHLTGRDLPMDLKQYEQAGVLPFLDEAQREAEIQTADQVIDLFKRNDPNRRLEQMLSRS